MKTVAQKFRPGVQPANPARERAVSRAGMSLQGLVNESPRMNLQARLHALIATSPRQLAQRRQLAGMFGPALRRPATTHEKDIQTADNSAAPIQRVIAGLDAYTDARNIPAEWVTAYANDIKDWDTHLTDEHLLFLYQSVRGKTPEKENVEFEHVGGNHWNVKVNGLVYLATPDGSCALHAVDLADRVLKGEAIDRATYHSAEGGLVLALRNALYTHVVDEEGEDEIRRVIAKGIKDSDSVPGSGFGPQLSEFLTQKVILANPPWVPQVFEIAYANLSYRTMNLPKPSEAKKILAGKSFFSKSYGSLNEMMQQALAVVHAASTFGSGVSFKDKVYEDTISKSLRSSYRHFYSAKEAAAELGKIKKKSAEKKRSLTKRRLRGGWLISRESKDSLAAKLKDPRFVAKIMNASGRAGVRLTGAHKEIANLVGKGQVDLSKLKLSTSEKFAAFESFKSRKSKQKTNLQFGVRGANKSSFGSGGFQVKGLSTYPNEMIWFANQLKIWKCSEADLFAAMQEKNYDALVRLTNEKDAVRLLRFEDLQILERWRAGPFGTGVAAWARLGYHGRETFSGYMRSMPMREGDATKNVSNTEDYAKPHLPQLWNEQQQNTVAGIERLMDIEVAEGGVYDERTRTYLEQLVAEPVEGEPTDQMIEESANIMQSPNPYINEDADEEGKT
jgi:hypothetical protein